MSTSRKKLTAMRLKIILLVMVSLMLSSVHAHAALTQNDISMLYVSIFNRASEGEGNAFWRNRPDLQSMADTATAMLDTDAARSYFGTSLNSNQAFIEHIYLNTLNKTYAVDPDGINYWVGELNKGKSRGEVVADLVGVIKEYAPGGPYYKPNDPATIAAYDQFTNRVAVSNYMADTLLNPPANWQTTTQFGLVGLNVSSEGSTVTAAKEVINQFAGNTGGLKDDIESYMALITSAGELTPMVDEISVLLGTILSGDSSVVSIDPPLQTIDLNDPPENIFITANFGNGYTPEGTSGFYTGLATINITGISFTQTVISANVAMNASNIMRNGEPVLNGGLNMVLNAGMAGDTTNITANVTFSTLTSMDTQINGGIVLNAPGISGEGQLTQPITVNLNNLSTLDYLMNGTVTINQVSTEIFDINFSVATNEGPVTGVLRTQMNPSNFDQTILSTPSGSLTVGTASVTINQVVMDPYVCEDLPVSGTIVVNKGGETATIAFDDCVYTVN